MPDISTQQNVKVKNPQKKRMEKKQEGCYIATSIYGSYDSPELWVLRRFRDYFLSMSFFGRLFIKLYYFISPIIVKLFGNKDWFNSFFKSKLDKLVCNLQKRGFKSTFYFDK